MIRALVVGTLISLAYTQSVLIEPHATHSTSTDK